MPPSDLSLPKNNSWTPDIISPYVSLLTKLPKLSLTVNAPPLSVTAFITAAALGVTCCTAARGHHPTVLSFCGSLTIIAALSAAARWIRRVTRGNFSRFTAPMLLATLGVRVKSLHYNLRREMARWWFGADYADSETAGELPPSQQSSCQRAQHKAMTVDDRREKERWVKWGIEFMYVAMEYYENVENSIQPGHLAARLRNIGKPPNGVGSLTLADLPRWYPVGARPGGVSIFTPNVSLDSCAFFNISHHHLLETKKQQHYSNTLFFTPETRVSE